MSIANRLYVWVLMVARKKETLAYPKRKVTFEFYHATAGDAYFTRMIHSAWNEFVAANPTGKGESGDVFVSSNGIQITQSWPRRLED